MNPLCICLYLRYVVIDYFIRSSFDWVKGDESWIVVVSE